MKNNKILIIINNLGVGGAERLVIDDINEMLKKGFDINLITLRPEFEKSLESQCNISSKNKTLVNFNGIFNIKSYIKLVGIIKNINPDLVISHLWFANSISRIACIFSRIKNIICFEQNVYDSVKTKKMFIVDFLLQFFCRKIIAVSYTVKESLVRHLIFRKRIEVIYSCIDIEKYRNGRNIRENLNISQNDFVYTFIGRLIDQKGVDTLIKAFSDLERGILIIVGEGKDEYKLKKIARDKYTNGKIIFTGHRSDIPDILKSSDCFVFPSRYEGVGLVLLESMASGLPAIITNFSAGIEIIKDGHNGLVVPIDDIKELTIAMNMIYHDKKLREKIIKNSSIDIKSFSISSHVSSIISYI